jgi:hypothetical protein
LLDVRTPAPKKRAGVLSAPGLPVGAVSGLPDGLGRDWGVLADAVEGNGIEGAVLAFDVVGVDDGQFVPAVSSVCGGTEELVLVHCGSTWRGDS